MSPLLDIARRLELSQPREIPGGVAGLYDGLEVALHGEERVQSLSVALGRPLGIARLAARRGDPPHVDEVLTGDDALQALLMIHAAPGRAPAVRLVLEDAALREALRQLALDHPELAVDADWLSVGAGPEPEVTLREACAVVQRLQARFDATRAGVVPSEAPVVLPTQTPREWLASRGVTPGNVFGAVVGAGVAVGWSWWALDGLGPSASVGEFFGKLVCPLLTGLALVILFRK